MRTIRQIAAIAVVSGVAVASLAGPAAASKPKPVTTKDPAASAARYLIGQLGGKDNNHYSETLGGTVYPQYGETADAVLSMDAAGVGQKAARAATKYLEKNAVDYLTGSGYTPGQYYPGSAAKLLLVADAQHLGYENFGGQDLLGDIVSDEGAGGGANGQYVNPGDTMYSSSITNQSLAILALASTPKVSAQPSDDAVNFLLGQQCADGSFQNDIRADTTIACDPTKVDVDATAYAIQALEATNQSDTASKAITWLKSVEKKNGGWSENTGKPDANSTAIAVEALVSAGKSAKAGEAFLAAAQLGCSASKAQRGAVTAQGTYKPLTAVFATSQAGVALAGKDLASVNNKGANPASSALACKKK